MAFPASILDLRAELLLSGTWTNISTYVYNRAPVIITRGHPDESTGAPPPSTLSATFDNRDARFSPRNPLGAWYGQIGRNTQIRSSLPEGASYLRIETDQASYASTPDSAGLSITGDMQAEIDVTLDNWNAAQILCCKWITTGNQRSWILLLNEDGTLTFDWSSGGGGISQSATSTLPVPVPGLGRMAIKVTMATATGQVKFFTAPNISTAYVKLGLTVTPGAAAVFDSTAAVQAGYGTATGMTGYTGIYGKVHAFKLLNGIGGTLQASPDFTIQAAGATSFADAQGNTWTVQGTAEISDRKYRFHGEVPAWPVQQDQSGGDVYDQVQAAGILRRLQAGTAPPLDSPLKRGLQRAAGAAAPVAYWACEDGAGSNSIASGLPGGTPMRVTGSPTFASDAGFACSAPVPLISNSEWRGTIPQHSADSANVLRWLMRVPFAGATSLASIMTLHTSGGISRIEVFWNGPGNGADIQAFDANGNQIVASLAGDLAVAARRVLMSAELTFSGGNATLTLYSMGVTGTVTSVSATFATAAAIGNGTRVTVGVTPTGLHVDDTAIGHIWYQGATDPLGGYLSLLNAWAGETAGNRFSRLCSEQGVPFRAAGQLSGTTAMGVQAQIPFMSLLQECADADRGQVFEPRQAFALGYRTRASMQSQPAAVTLAYDQAQLSVLQETDDDQQTVNDVTVTRAYGGSSARQVLTTGPLSTAAPPDGVGTYPATPGLNLAADSQLGDMTGWLLHMGTVDEPRYPQIGVDLSRPQLAAVFYDCQELDIGDRLAVTGMPAWLPPDGISQLVQGLTEVLAGYTAGNSPFTIAWQCVPESPWQTGIADDPLYAQADTDGATLHANLASGATSMTADTAAAADHALALWTTDAGNMPFGILMGGERITVTAISGAANPQTFTITRSVNGVVKAHTAGEQVRLFYPTIVSL
jgi:hypothetical protein